MKSNGNYLKIAAILVLFAASFGCSRGLKKYIVPNYSGMSPTYQANDILWVDQYNADLEDISRFDVVLCELYDEFDCGFYYVFRRVIGFPGERIVVREGKVYVNGRAIDGDEMDEEFSGLLEKHIELEFDSKSKINDEHVWIIGDDFEHALDSRNFGEFSVSKIVGIVKREELSN